MPLPFTPSAPLTLGLELELQVLDLRTFNLTRGASDLLAAIGAHSHRGEIKPEVTESMIEIATGVAVSTDDLARDLDSIQGVLLPAAQAMTRSFSAAKAHTTRSSFVMRIHP